MVTATVIRITAMATATPPTGMATDTRAMAMPVTAMAIRRMAMVMGPAITAITDTAITRLSALPTSGVTGATKQPTRVRIIRFDLSNAAMEKPRPGETGALRTEGLGVSG